MDGFVIPVRPTDIRADPTVIPALVVGIYRTPGVADGGGFAGCQSYGRAGLDACH